MANRNGQICIIPTEQCCEDYHNYINNEDLCYNDPHPSVYRRKFADYLELAQEIQNDRIETGKRQLTLLQLRTVVKQCLGEENYKEDEMSFNKIDIPTRNCNTWYLDKLMYDNGWIKDYESEELVEYRQTFAVYLETLSQIQSGQLSFKPKKESELRDAPQSGLRDICREHLWDQLLLQKWEQRRAVKEYYEQDDKFACKEKGLLCSDRPRGC